jgi:hypothetical protein
MLECSWQQKMTAFFRLSHSRHETAMNRNASANARPYLAIAAAAR